MWVICTRATSVESGYEYLLRRQQVFDNRHAVLIELCLGCSIKLLVDHRHCVYRTTNGERIAPRAGPRSRRRAAPARPQGQYLPGYDQYNLYIYI